MAIANTYPPIPVGVQVLVLSTLLFGIVANMFFINILLRYHRGWNPGKLLLLAFHVAALLLLLCIFLPLVVVVSTGRDLTPAQCTAPVLINQGASCALPLSLGVAAHFRRKTVQLALGAVQAPNIKRYLCIMLAFVFDVVALVNAASNGGPYEWNGPLMLCLSPVPLYVAILNLILFITAPYVVYCYRKIFAVIRDNARDGAAEIVRAVYILVVFFYVTYLPLFVAAMLEYVAGVVTVPAIGYQLLQWINLTYTALSPLVSIVTIPRYRAIAVSILTCQTAQMTGSTKGLAAQSRRSTKMTVRGHNSMTSASVRIAVAPGMPDAPMNETEASTVSM